MDSYLGLCWFMVVVLDSLAVRTSSAPAASSLSRAMYRANQAVHVSLSVAAFSSGVIFCFQKRFSVKARLHVPSTFTVFGVFFCFSLVSGTFDLFNVMCRQHHWTALNPLLNSTKNGDIDTMENSIVDNCNL